MNNVIFASRSVTPSKIVCVGRNYVAHINELGNKIPDNPVLFIKPNSAISDTLVFDSNEAIHYEGEIAFIVENGQLAGVGFGFDLTKRELQVRLQTEGLPWERAKAFNNAAVFSEFVPITGDLAGYSMQLIRNGALVQQGGVELMLYKPHRLLSEVSGLFSLENGDIIMTGTPKGAGALSRGDSFTGQIFNDGQLIVERHWQVCEDR